ncbi:hypothetical protein CAter10_2914 [Collimonas arenae]|nr:hypothetical protein CAter10_2914 [Collimonas arenae]
MCFKFNFIGAVEIQRGRSRDFGCKLLPLDEFVVCFEANFLLRIE